MTTAFLERIKRWFQKNPAVGFLIALGIAVIAIGNFTEAIENIERFGSRLLGRNQTNTVAEKEVVDDDAKRPSRQINHLPAREEQQPDPTIAEDHETPETKNWATTPDSTYRIVLTDTLMISSSGNTAELRAALEQMTETNIRTFRSAAEDHASLLSGYAKLPHEIKHETPIAAYGDLNHDGVEDFVSCYVFQPFDGGSGSGKFFVGALVSLPEDGFEANWFEVDALKDLWFDGKTLRGIVWTHHPNDAPNFPSVETCIECVLSSALGCFRVENEFCGIE